MLKGVEIWIFEWISHLGRIFRLVVVAALPVEIGLVDVLGGAILGPDGFVTGDPDPAEEPPVSVGGRGGDCPKSGCFCWGGCFLRSSSKNVSNTGGSMHI